MISQEYYDILGVSRNSSEEDIKRVYKQLSKIYHPDLNKEPYAKEKFIKIQNAYEKIINLSSETPSFFQSSAIPSIDSLFEEMLNPNSETNINWKKEKERPKTMSEILKSLIDGINGYCTEILDNLFVNTEPKWKEIFADWNNDFDESEELKKEIYKEELKSYTEIFENDCMSGYDDECPINEGMEEKERKKLCKKCFEKDRKEWLNKYKRAMDIGFAYLRAYLEATPKHYKPLRKYYNSKKVKTGSVKNWL